MGQVLTSIYTSHVCPEGTQTKTASPAESAPLHRPSPPALLTCASSAGGRRLIGARWGRCHVLPHPAGGRASPHRPTPPRAGSCAPHRVPGMLGGARGCFPRSAGSRTGRPEDRAGEHWPSRLALHRARRRPGRCCLPRPRAQFTAPLTFPARPRPVRPAAFSGLHPRGRVSGFSATQGPFPASQPLCVRATCPLPALRPSLP